MRRVAAWADSVVDCRGLEQVREATGLSDVEARDRVRVAIGFWVGERGGGTLGGWRPLGVGIWYVGSGIGGPGNSEVVLGGAGGGHGTGGLAGWWAAEAPPLEIGKETPLEVDAESLLDLEGGWEQMGGVLWVGGSLPVLE